MGVFDKFLDIMKLNDDDYDDDFYDDDEYLDDGDDYDEKPSAVRFSERKIRKKITLMISIWKRRRITSLPQAIK